MTEEEFWAALSPLPEPARYFYRLYHDDNGLPLFYSMEDKPGKYVEIDQATFNNPPKYAKVIDGKLIELKITPTLKLHPSSTGTSCHPTNVSIVVNETQPHKKWILK